MPDKKCGCQKPDRLKGKPGDCTPDEIKKCHGQSKKHPCCGKSEEDEAS